jgi:hypothetical protein
VLHDIQRRRFLVHPPREDPPPFLVGALHVQLQEGAGQLLLFPRSGRLAGPKVNDRVARADGLSRLQPEIVDDAVALVEEADDRDPVLHRRQPGLIAFEHLAGVRRLRLLLVAALLLPARRERQSQRHRNDPREAHSYSGIQGW